MSDKTRRMVGFLVGMIFGLPYSIISEYINVWLLPGIPLGELPVGHVATIIVTTLGLGILGLMVAWEKESFRGVVAGAIFIVAAGSYLAYLNSGSTEAVKTLILFLFTFLPRTVLYVPVTLFLAWVMNQAEQVATRPASSGQRTILVTAALLIAALVGGSFSRYSPPARLALQDANQLTQAGIAAVAQKTALPDALVPVEGFSAYASGAYTLKWSDAVDTLNVVRPATAEPVIESLIIIHFANGYKFGCVYTPPSRIPKCINITLVQ